MIGWLVKYVSRYQLTNMGPMFYKESGNDVAIFFT